MYVAIEGIDTVGKSTQIEALAKIFTQAVFTKEPGGTHFGSMIREVILHREYSLCSVAELFLFLADRAEHFDKVIKPHLNGLIISDRSLISGIAYAQNVDFAFLKRANQIAMDHILPDLVIWLHIDKQTLKQRLQHKEPDRLESRGIEYLLHIQDRLEETIKALEVPFIKIPSAWDAQKITQKITQKIKLSY